jgi:hypothetical protein
LGGLDVELRVALPEEGFVERSALAAQADVGERPVVLVGSLLVENQRDAFALELAFRKRASLRTVGLDGLVRVHGLRGVHADKPHILLPAHGRVHFDGVAINDPLDRHRWRGLGQGGSCKQKRTRNDQQTEPQHSSSRDSNMRHTSAGRGQSPISRCRLRTAGDNPSMGWFETRREADLRKTRARLLYDAERDLFRWTDRRFAFSREYADW